MPLHTGLADRLKVCGCKLLKANPQFHSLSGTSLLHITKSVPTPCRLLRVSATASSLVTLLVLSRAPVVDSPFLSQRRHHGSHKASQTSSTQAQSSDPAPAEDPAQTQPVEMQKPEIPEALKQAKAEALWGMFAADSVAMPVHWFYHAPDIKATYGGYLTKYTAPARKHPSSILTISNQGGSGRRGGKDGFKNVIGDVILHDKLKYWTSGDSSIHYHQGMKAGDSTLNAIMALQMVETMNRVDPDFTKPDREVRAAVLEDYVKLMTTPGTHNDTYAESFHRSFFKDWAELSNPPHTGEEILEFAEKRYKEKVKSSPDSQLVVVGALVPAIPWILRSAHLSETECARSTVEFIKLTHPVSSLTSFVEVYARLLHGVLHGHNLKDEAIKLLGHSEFGGPQKREMVFAILDKAHQYPKGSEARLKVYQEAVGMMGLACYIEGAMTSMLFLASEFHDDFEAGILANANCGGENCHRGAALGALLGAAAAGRGQTVPQQWKEGLHAARPRLNQAIQDMNNV